MESYVRALKISDARASKFFFCAVAPDICGSSVWNLLDVTLLVSKVLRGLLDLLEIWISLLHYHFHFVSNPDKMKRYFHSCKRPDLMCKPLMECVTDHLSLVSTV